MARARASSITQSEEIRKPITSLVIVLLAARRCFGEPGRAARATRDHCRKVVVVIASAPTHATSWDSSVGVGVPCGGTATGMPEGVEAPCEAGGHAGSAGWAPAGPAGVTAVSANATATPAMGRRICFIGIGGDLMEVGAWTYARRVIRL